MHRPRKIRQALLAFAIYVGATLTSAKSEIPDPTKKLEENIDIAIELIMNPAAPLEEATKAAIFPWIEDVCAENNNYVFIGQDSYFRLATNRMPRRQLRA